MQTASDPLNQQPIPMAHVTHPKQTLRQVRRTSRGVWDTTKACLFLDQK